MADFYRIIGPGQPAINPHNQIINLQDRIAVQARIEKNIDVCKGTKNAKWPAYYLLSRVKKNEQKAKNNPGKLKNPNIHYQMP